MKSCSVLLGAVCLLLSVFLSQASTLYVDLNSSNPVSPYTSWSTAATNIQDAIDASTDGDLILVTNGVYATSGRVTGDGTTNRVVADKAVTVQSVNGQTATLIDGGQSFRCAYLTNGAVLSGFTLTNGTAGGGNGGGAWCASTGEQILNCLLTKNSAWDGAGVYSGTLTNCSFSGNQATDSGGGAAYSTLNNCTFSGNSAGFSGSGGGAYNATLNNCTLSGNSAGWNGGGAAYCTLNCCTINGNTARYTGGGARSSTLTSCKVTGNTATDSSGSGGGAAYCNLVNCTVTGNTAPAWGGGTAWCPVVNNCIIYYNSASDGANDSGGTLSYCCTTPLASGTGNFADDPQFVNYAGGDLHLAANSLCINTGGNDYVTNSTDLDGNPRLVGGVVDVGAYECQTVLPVPVAPSLQATYTQVITGFVVGFTGYIGGRPTASRWEFGDGTIISNQLPNVSHAWAAPGNYAVALRAYNDSFPDGVTATVTIQVSGTSGYYVRQTNAQPAWPYTSWNTAATNIQAAVDAAYAGATVWVSNGVYQAGGRVIYGLSLSNRIVVSKPVTVRSVNGPDVTVIQGYRASVATNAVNNVRCVYLASGAALAGFTVTNGGTRNSGSVSDVSGGGIWCDSSSTIVSNCVLAGNYATNYGGGIYSGTLYNCKLVGNTAPYGGGGHNCALYNCIVATNTGSTNGMYGSYGGGIYSGKLCNCTLVGNSASYGGGVYNSTLTNCTLANNTASTSGGGGYSSTLNNCVDYYNTAASGSNYSGGSLSYCCAKPLAAGTGNFTNAPLFVDLAGGNFRLQTNSPCIGTGNNAYVTTSVDLDGRPRIVGGTVDMGAYEFQGAGMGEFIAWLQQYGMAIDGSADYADPDGDHMNNWQEWRAGTNPTNAASVLKLASLSNSISGITVTWQSVNTRTYYLQVSTNLASQPAFITVQSNLAGQTGTTSYTDTMATNGGPYFYRVGVQ
jgi:hypothetical protein